LGDTPVVVVEGARQVGKSTLAHQVLAHRSGRLLTLDDEQVLAAAQFDPAAFVERHDTGLLVIDEIQLAPRLLRAIKAAVDADRRPGAYLLTGSANLLTMPGAQESLAGRAETVRLFGFSQGELTGGSDSLGQVLLSGHEGPLSAYSSSMGRADYLSIIETGSYPEAQTRTARRRGVWIDNYVTRLLSRDADRISTLAHLDRLPQLLAVLAANTSGELVKARVAADVNLPETSLPPYLDLLDSFGLIHTLAPWGRNLRQRVVGRRKVALLDTAVACHLAGLSAAAMAITEPDAARAGQLLETLVAAELRKQSTWSQQPFDLFHFRQRSGSEVDIVLETPDRRVAGIEVKASSTVDPRDFRGLHHLAEMAGPRFTLGAVLHTGKNALRFGPRMWALPVSALWL
jgi:hypothetical protein